MAIITIRKSTSKPSNKKSINNNSEIGYRFNNLLLAGVIILLATILLWILYKLYTKYIKTSFQNVPDMKRPFLNMWAVRKDGSEFLANIVFITHPFTRDECIMQYNDAKSQGIHFLGLSSYSEFPGHISNPHDALHDPNIDAWTKYNYFQLTRGWLSCFREENNKKWIQKDFPHVNIAESDFANYEFHQPDSTIKKEYDFIYICLKDGDKKESDKDCPMGWQAEIRQWETVKKLLDIMCKEFKLKGLLIGRVGCEIPAQCHQLMETTDFMEYNTFIKQYNKSRFILSGSFQDASPRVVSEGMCYNLPVLMNKNILGGWQYINDETGEFYNPNDINEFKITLQKFLKKLDNNEYHSREWFIKHYGKYNSGKKLKTFISQVFKESELNFKLDEIDYLKPGI